MSPSARVVALGKSFFLQAADLGSIPATSYDTLHPGAYLPGVISEGSQE